MNTNDNVELNKSNFFSKIFKFIKSLFKTTKALPVPDTLNEELANYEMITNENKEKLEELDITNIQEDFEVDSGLLDLQKEFESNKIKLIELSDEDLKNLNNLYIRQIAGLKQQLRKAV